jgi:hypothetical protein
LSYRSHKITIENKNVTEFIRELAAGKFLIPAFQRAFVWNPEHIAGLWDSVYRCYPIGSILYWKTRSRLNIHRRIGGFFVPVEQPSADRYHPLSSSPPSMGREQKDSIPSLLTEESQPQHSAPSSLRKRAGELVSGNESGEAGQTVPPSPLMGEGLGESKYFYSYILDGQQRATSLLVSFLGGKDGVNDDKNFDYTLYFDLAKEEFFFEGERYRHLWDADKAFLLRLKDVPDLPAGHGRELEKVRGYNEKIGRRYEQLKYAFTNYTLPLVCLQGYTMRGVCDVFERMNRTGVRLENLDIIIARNFRNYDTVIEEDFNP